MKKIRIIGLIAGIMTLAIGASATYAWFTSQADKVSLNVTAATINIANGKETADVSNKLPGEAVEFTGLEFANNSTRESVVQISFSILEAVDGEGAPLRQTLIDEMDASMKIADLKASFNGTQNKIFVDTDGTAYIYLNPDQDLDDVFSIEMILPNELGGNVSSSEPEGSRSDDQQNEHGSVITMQWQAYAVQGTRDAVEDVFGTNIADEFFTN